MASALAPYSSPEQRDASLMRLTEALGGELHPLGQSVQGRPIYAASLPQLEGERPIEPSAHLFLGANIHGVEFIASAVALGFMEALIDKSSPAAALRARAQLWIVPSINPDAYAETWAREGVGTVGQLRCNANGVDLNRNFPLPAPQRPIPLKFAGTDDPQHPCYRGKAPLSEPETRALATLFERVPFTAAANLHSFMGTMIPARVTARAHLQGYKRLCGAFRAAQTGPKYRRLQSGTFDVFTGEQEDHQHHIHRTWACCVEIFPFVESLKQHLRAPCTFWRFNPRDPTRYINNDVPALAAYFQEALEMGRVPKD